MGAKEKVRLLGWAARFELTGNCNADVILTIHKYLFKGLNLFLTNRRVDLRETMTFTTTFEETKYVHIQDIT